VLWRLDAGGDERSVGLRGHGRQLLARRVQVGDEGTGIKDFKFHPELDIRFMIRSSVFAGVRRARPGDRGNQVDCRDGPDAPEAKWGRFTVPPWGGLYISREADFGDRTLLRTR
jgi:hypothetical protein